MPVERDPRLGLQDREQSVDGQEVVQISTFLIAERAGLRLVGERGVHAVLFGREIQREHVPRVLRRKPAALRFDDPFEDTGL